MGLYEVPLSRSLLGFGVGTIIGDFHMCGIMFVLSEVFNMLVRNASPRGLSWIVTSHRLQLKPSTTSDKSPRIPLHRL